jgi:hypothetical protein
VNASAVKERLIELGATPIGGSPDQFAALIRSDYEKWGPSSKRPASGAISPDCAFAIRERRDPHFARAQCGLQCLIPGGDGSLATASQWKMSANSAASTKNSPAELVPNTRERPSNVRRSSRSRPSSMK